MATAQADLNTIAVFVRVVESGGFTAGAKALGIPKSSASRRVKQLEDDLGVRLLQRTTRRLSLTDAGRDYFERVASALAGVQEAQAAVTEQQDVPKGVVRLAAPSDWASWLLAPVIASFVEAHPLIRIDLSLTNRQVDLVRDGFDLALTTGPLTDSSLIVRSFGTITCGLFASESYVARHGLPVTVDDLSAHAFIVVRPGPTDRLRLTGPEGATTVVVKGPVATDDRSFVYEAVRAGAGIGVLPVSGCVTHLRLIRLLPEYDLPGFTSHIVYPSSRHVPQRVALFRDALLEAFTAHREECATAVRE
jgi:DNA-binding transcriptional LysR family regulator